MIIPSARTLGSAVSRNDTHPSHFPLKQHDMRPPRAKGRTGSPVVLGVCGHLCVSFAGDLYTDYWSVAISPTLRPMTRVGDPHRSATFTRAANRPISQASFLVQSAVYRYHARPIGPIWISTFFIPGSPSLSSACRPQGSVERKKTLEMHPFLSPFAPTSCTGQPPRVRAAWAVYTLRCSRNRHPAPRPVAPARILGRTNAVTSQPRLARSTGRTHLYPRVCQPCAVCSSKPRPVSVCVMLQK